MTKKTLVSIFFILGLSFLLVWLLTKVIQKPYSNGDDFSAIPVDAAFIIQSEKIPQFLSEIQNNAIWNELSKLVVIHKIDRVLNVLDSVSSKNKRINDILENGSLKVSCHVISKKSPDFLFILNTEGKLHQKEAEEIIEKIHGGENVQILTRKYEGIDIIDVKVTSESTKVFSCYLYDRYFIFSFSPILLESSVRTLKQSVKINHDPAFVSLLKTAGKNVEANVMVNYNNFARLLEITSKNISASDKKFLQNISDWAVFDLGIHDNIWFFNGFTNYADSLNKFISVIKNQHPQMVELPAMAPSNTHTYFSIVFDNFKTYFNDYRKFLAAQGKISSVNAFLENFNRQTSIDLEETLGKLAKNEIGIVYTNFPQQTKQDNVFALMETMSGSLAKSLLSEIASKTNRPSGSGISRIQIDRSTSYNVYHINKPEFLKSLFGELFEPITENYATVLDNFIVFGNSKNALTKWIHFYLLGKTLSSDIEYQQQSKYFSSQSNITFYTDIPEGLELYKNVLSPALMKTLTDNEEVFQKVRSLGVQFHTSGDMVFHSIYIKYLDQFSEKAHTVWETLLDTTINFKPTFVKNHITGENEIFIQDQKNNIYLINKIGRVLWKIKLSEPITGDIYQVDYYKNGKLQLLFTTSNQIHLIDRNGNYVARYPIQLRSKTIAGMSLFDYDNDKEFRIFIPCVDKKIYLYDIEGNIIQGWEFGMSDEVVRQPAKHIRIGNKDYIVFSDDIRLYILNRRGETRVPVNEIVLKSANNPIYFEEQTQKNKTRLVFTDTAGTVNFFYFDGNHETKKIVTCTSKHYFLYEDMNDDGYNDFIFLDNKELRVYQQDGEKLYAYKFEKEPDQAPIFFDFGYNDKKLGIVIRDLNKIYLINNDGELYDGFPLQGVTMFSIGRLANISRFNLIVGNNDNFLLNYSVQ